MSISTSTIIPKKNVEKVVFILKISLIFSFSVYLLGNFIPFYESNDSYTLASIAIFLSENNFISTNPLLEQTEHPVFVPGDWFQTIDKKHMFPGGAIFFHYFVSSLYYVGGNFSLFYFGPVLSIFLLIISDRVATKLFNPYVGLLTLLFLCTNHIFLRSSVTLGVDIIFSIFFVLGTYYLIQFLKKNNSYEILLASTFFVLSSLIRINGVVFFPIELIILSSFFIFNFKNKILKTKLEKNSKLSNQYFKKISLMFIPWIIFFIFWFSYNGILFDDPFTNYAIEQRGYENTDAKISSLVIIEEKHFENFKQYSKYLLPYQFPALEKTIFVELNSIFGEYWLGIASMILLFFILLISFKSKKNRIPFLVFTFLIIGSIWFFASVTNDEKASQGVVGRYIMPTFIIFYMILGSFFFDIFKKSSSISNYKISKLFRFSIVFALGLFFMLSLSFTPFSEAVKNNNFELKNPFEYSIGHPPSTNFSSNSIIAAIKTDRVIEYDVIPFHILTKDGLATNDSINILKQLLQENKYDIYIFKQPTTSFEKSLLIDLTLNHNFVLTDYSTVFCKLSLMEESAEKSNPSCLAN